MTIKVVLADDHSIVRAGIKAVLSLWADIAITGEASNGVELLAIAKNKPADIYIVDISMPDLNGIEAIGRLHAVHPDFRALILSMHESRTFVEKSIRAGARGYILKENAANEITTAVRAVHSGDYYISPPMQEYVIAGFLNLRSAASAPTPSGLTKQERRILQLIAEGNSNRDISASLHIAVNTVHAHRNSLMRKLNIHKQSDLIRYAIKEGIVAL